MTVIEAIKQQIGDSTYHPSMAVILHKGKPKLIYPQNNISFQNNKMPSAHRKNKRHTKDSIVKVNQRTGKIKFRKTYTDGLK